MNIDKSCYNSSCSRRFTERNAAILSSYNISYGKMTNRRDTRRILCEENAANIFLNTNRTNLPHFYLFVSRKLRLCRKVSIDIPAV